MTSWTPNRSPVAAPHVHGRSNIPQVMRTVLLALLPATATGVWLAASEEEADVGAHKVRNPCLALCIRAVTELVTRNHGHQNFHAGFLTSSIRNSFRTSGGISNPMRSALAANRAIWIFAKRAFSLLIFGGVYVA